MPVLGRNFTSWVWIAPWALTVAHGQELEPRAYSDLPISANFLAATYSLLTGDVLTDPSLPISDVRARIAIYGAGYVRAFDLFGRTASIGIFMPFASSDVSGNVFDAPNSVHRAGIGDTRVRLAVNFLGGPALKPADFLKRTPTATLGGSVTVIAPTGHSMRTTGSTLVPIVGPLSRKLDGRSPCATGLQRFPRVRGSLETTRISSAATAVHNRPSGYSSCTAAISSGRPRGLRPMLASIPAATLR